MLIHGQFRGMNTLHALDVKKKSVNTKTLNLPTSKQFKTKIPAELLNSYFATRPEALVSKSRNVLPFKALPKKEQFDRLPQEEKDKLLNICKSLMDKEKNVFLTVLNQKPSAYCTLSKEKVATLEKHRNLLESDTFRLVLEPSDKKTDRNYRRFFLINVPLLRQVVEENLGYFQLRLNDRHLNTEGVVKKILDKDSPLLNLQNFHDFIGLSLGFPVKDNFLFRATSDIDDMIEFLEKKGQGKSIQARVLKAMHAIARSDLRNYKQAFANKIPEVIKSLELKSPTMSFPSTTFYRFVTWDSKSPEMQRLDKIIKEATPVVEEMFKEPQDLLNKLLKIS